MRCSTSLGSVPPVVRIFRALLILAATMPLGFGVVEAQTLPDASISEFEWRNIGPANMAGRVTDIEAVEANPAVVYVGAASGGVWKSVNAGTTWEPIFEDYGTANIGDIAIFQPNPEIVWVGTGESDPRNSAAWGDGIYKSVDGGATFTHMGLRDSHHIGEVITHPTDPDVVYVASQGHLWGYGGDMGVYRTTDGGESWERLTNGLPDDGRTGATDMQMHPTDPNTLYVTMWERIRYPHTFESGGPNGGIFKSTDGGESWTKLTEGLPEGDVGKIGVSVSRSNPDVVMAIVEHGFQPQAMVDGSPNPAYEDMSQLGTGVYRSEDAGQSWSYVNRYNYRPFYYSHIIIDPNDDERVYLLVGSGQWSEDGGRTFTGQMGGISGDFHALWIDPANSDRYYVGNDKGSYVTYDRGETFIMFDNMDIGQFYAVDVDMRDPYWVYGGLQDNGNWGGPSNSRDWNGIMNDHWFKFHSGDGFHTTVDPNDWRTVYTESQGGNIRRLDAVFRQQGGGITPNRNNVLNLAEVVPEAAEAPQGGGGFGGGGLPREHFRFNWSSPLVLSPHDSKTLLFGGNYLFRSTDQGETWRIISPDLSTADPEFTDPASGGLTEDITGAETHATIITVMESAVRPGVIWAGTDDGRVQVTRDGGGSWSDVSGNLPAEVAGLWVSRVEPSHFSEGTAYVSLDGHRSDEFSPWIFKTTDFGTTWTRITNGIEDGHSIYVVREDLKNPNLLFAGSEFAVFVSTDGGANWQRLMENMPTVAIHDLVIHPRDGDLIAGTHGRSVWILDDISPLQQLTEEVRASDLHVFENRVATRWRGVSRGATRGHKLFMGRNPLTMSQQGPGNSPREIQNSAAIHFWLGSEPSGTVRVEVMDPSSGDSFTTEVEGHSGVNRFMWNLRFAPPEGAGAGPGGGRGGGFGGFGGRGGFGGAEAAAGTYRVRITANGVTRTGSVTLREDPGIEGVLPAVR